MNPVLEITGLRKSYRSPTGEKSLVIDVPEYAVGQGEQVALAGESGSGKTTLLHLIAGVLAPDSGKIVVAGEEITALNEARRDRVRALHVGYVFQTFNLLQGYTALQNVILAMTFGRGADDAAARHLLTRVGLGDRMDHRPRQLSVGQQQRVAVARAVANRPRLVLADEPTGNLDRQRAADAITLLREVCAESGAALLVVSHDPRILGLFPRVDELASINRATGDPVTEETPA